jgi:hypothetical protein
VLPIIVHHSKKPVSTWWKTKPGRMTPEFFIRALPLFTLMYCFLVTSLYWPVSVIGAEVCFAYEGMVEFQVPENIQLYFVCPRFGYELGEYVQKLHADEDALKADIESLRSGLRADYASSPNMLALNAAWGEFEMEKDKIDEGLGECQPMSDTIELATAQVCDEVILGMQMMTAISFGLTCLLMYGTLHKWFGSDVAKELANDEEESLFSKLTSESLIEARSKFGSKETESSKKLSKKRDKKKRRKRRGDGDAPSSGGPTSASEGEPSGSPPQDEREMIEPIAEAREMAEGEDAPAPEAMEIEMQDVMNDDAPQPAAAKEETEEDKVDEDEDEDDDDDEDEDEDEDDEDDDEDDDDDADDEEAGADDASKDAPNASKDAPEEQAQVVEEKIPEEPSTPVSTTPNVAADDEAKVDSAKRRL